MSKSMLNQISKVFILLVIFSGCLFFANTASAATYYVSTADGDDTNCTGLNQTAYVSGSSQPCPWKTLTKVNAAMTALTIQAGDSILFKKGETFAGNLVVEVTGTAGNILTFDAYGSTGANPIIDAAGNIRAIDIRGKNYVTFQNLTLINATSVGILLFTGLNDVTIHNITLGVVPTGVSVGAGTFSNITISSSTLSGTANGLTGATGTTFSNLTVSSSTFNGSSSGGFVLKNLISNPNTNVTISGSHFNGNNTVVGPNNSNAYIGPTNGLTITNSEFNDSDKGSGISLYGVTNATLQGLDVKNNWLNGLSITNLDTTISSGITLDDSHLDDNSQMGISYNGLALSGNGEDFTATNVTASNNGGDGFNIHGTWSDVVFDRCTAMNNGVDGASSDGDGYSYHDTSTGVIKNSIGKNNKKSAVAQVNDSIVTMTNNIFSHDTNGTVAIVYLNNGGPFNLYNNTVYSGGNTGTCFYADAATVTAKNNIVYGCNYGFRELAGGTFIEDYNLVYGANELYNGLTAGVHDISSNPEFVSAGSDFHLQSDSPAIDSGVDVGIVEDYDGISMPRGLSFEMGAYEYPVPKAPTIGTATAQSDSTIRWSFTDNSSDETSFKIYNGATVVASSTSANIAYLDETGLLPNTAYSNRFATAYNAYGDSATTTVASTTYTKTETLSDASWGDISISSNSITLTVEAFSNDSAGQSGYYFSRSGANSGWINQNTWTDSGLSCGEDYTYSVKYRNGDGIESNEVSITKTTNRCGGGSSGSSSSSAPKTPAGGFKVAINNGSPTTSNREVSLTFNVGENVKQMEISMFADFKNSVKEDYVNSKKWDLCPTLAGKERIVTCPNGNYTVYVKFYTARGRTSSFASASDSIELRSGVAQTVEHDNTQPTTNDSFTKTLKLNQIDAEVLKLQIFLNSDQATRVADSGVGSRGNETNFFGKLTEAAVIKFQEKYRQEILLPWNLEKGTGIVGRTTLMKLNQLISAR